jgi:hypothetical protein
MSTLSNQPNRMHLLTLRFSLTVFLIATLILNGFSQTEIRQYKIPSTPISTGYDVKNYSIEALPPDPIDANKVEDYIMSGTLFEDGHENNNTFWSNWQRRVGSKIHFMRVDAQGAVKLSVTYDDPNYYDERSVDIVPYTTSQSIIVAVVRENVYWKAKIKILIVDNTTGAVVSDNIVSWTDYIYPLHAIYANNFLYIGGFITTDTSAQTNSWDWAGDISVNSLIAQPKAAFVGMYSLTTPSTGFPFLTFDWNYKTYSSYDFDMIMRLKALSNGNIMVLGSSNVTTSDVPRQLASGTFAFMIDPFLTLMSPLISITDSTYHLGATRREDDKYEFGFDVQEADNGYFIYSNKFDPLNFHATYPMVSYVPLNFNVASSVNTARIHIYPASYPYLYPVNGGSCCSVFLGWACGSKLMVPFASSLPNGAGIHMSGLMAAYNDGSGCWNANGISSNGNHGPDAFNYLPFIAKLNTAWNGSSISSSIDYWKIYENSNYILNDVTFLYLGGGLSNNAWPTTFATDNLAFSNDMILNAPTWNLDPSPDRVNLKFIHTNSNGDIDPNSHDCDKTFINCIPANQEVVALRNGLPEMQLMGIGAIANSDPGESSMATLSVDDQNTCSGNGFYKTNSIIEINGLPVTLDIYPNPAHDYFYLNLKGNSNADAILSVALFNITGQKVADLYNGSNRQLQSTPQIKLPEVATGLYIVKVWNNGIFSGQYKLDIQ